MKKVSSITKKAFSSVEVLLAIATFSLVIVGIGGSISYILQNGVFFSNKNKAIYLAEEGIEAIRAIRNEEFSNLQDGEYGINIENNKWVLIPTQSVTDGFVRRIRITTIDQNTREVESIVQWEKETGGVNNVSLATTLTNWLRVVPLPNFQNPSITATLDLSGGQDAIDIVYKDNFAYIIRASGNPNFSAINITNQNAPVISNSQNLSGGSSSLFILGNYLFMSSGNNSTELRVGDISNGSSMNVISSYNAPGNANGLSVFANNNTVFLGRERNNSSELIILNYNSINGPFTELSSIETNSNVNDIIVIDNTLYLATDNSSQEIIVFNISNLAAPTLLGTYDIPGNTSATVLKYYNNNLIVGAANGNIYTLGVSNPSSISVINTLNLGGAINDISLDSNTGFAYIATANTTREFQVYNFTNPNSPQEISFLNLSDQIRALTYHRDIDSVLFASSSNSEEFGIIGSN